MQKHTKGQTSMLTVQYLLYCLSTFISFFHITQTHAHTETQTYTQTDVYTQTHTNHN